MHIFPWSLNTDVMLKRNLSNCIKVNDLVCFLLKAIAISEFESFPRLLQSEYKKFCGAFAPIIIINNSQSLSCSIQCGVTHTLTLYSVLYLPSFTKISSNMKCILLFLNKSKARCHVWINFLNPPCLDNAIFEIKTFLVDDRVSSP